MDKTYGVSWDYSWNGREKMRNAVLKNNASEVVSLYINDVLFTIPANTTLNVAVFVNSNNKLVLKMDESRYPYHANKWYWKSWETEVITDDRTVDINATISSYTLRLTFDSGTRPVNHITCTYRNSNP